MNQETNLDKALEAINNGEFVLVYDNDDREGEVDMIIASEFVTPKSIATMRNDAGGLICNCLHADFCDAIHLPFMVDIMKAATTPPKQAPDTASQRSAHRRQYEDPMYRPWPFPPWFKYNCAAVRFPFYNRAAHWVFPKS